MSLATTFSFLKRVCQVVNPNVTEKEAPAEKTEPPSIENRM